MEAVIVISHPGFDDLLRGISLNGRLEVKPNTGLGTWLSGNKQTIVGWSQLNQLGRGLQLLLQLSDDVATVVLK